MDLVIGSVGVMALVLGVVQFLKKILPIDGNWNIIAALVLGVVFGGLSYGIDNTLISAAWVPYIKWAVFSLSVGLGAAGYYDLGKTRFGTQ